MQFQPQTVNKKPRFEWYAADRIVGFVDEPPSVAQGGQHVREVRS
jgi:hypothetical protein